MLYFRQVIVMKKLDVYHLFYIFLVGSVIGWIIEGLWTFLRKGILINHSAVVIGPFNMIYGVCACIFSIILTHTNHDKKNSFLNLFAISFIVGTILEYFISLGMEAILGFTAWDYSQHFLNINGRVSLMYSMFWGFLGVLWIKYLYPFLINLIDKINVKIGKIIMVFIAVFLLFDVGLTFSAIERAHACDRGMPPANNYEKFLDHTFNSKYLKNMFNNHWK